MNSPLVSSREQGLLKHNFVLLASRIVKEYVPVACYLFFLESTIELTQDLWFRFLFSWLV